MSLFMNADEFGEVVDKVLAAVNPELLNHMDNVTIRIEDEHPSEDLLGLYEGVALPDRYDYSGFLPDTITLYRLPLLAEAEDLDDLKREIQTTLIHEIGHHVGMSEERLHELGWA
jgi:predicted Zn-dependent protease with MMP-like domain